MLLVFDLDDTLYMERDYVLSGFAAVAEHLAAEGIYGFFPAAAGAFEAGLRGTIFNHALRWLGVAAPPDRIDELVRVYRSHVPKIGLCEEVEPLLQELGSSHELGLLSDGPGRSQRRKVEALGLRPRLDRVLLTDEFGRERWKPSTFGFERISAGHPPGECMYIGDNPEKDFQAPLRLGWRCVRVKRPGGLHEGTPLRAGARAVPEIDSLAQLPPLLG